ncbi:XRE family transcriptional regulator [Bacillus sp. FJAT-52991]|uniref:XRE family transcriptional regulator n=1 Tax=Bacillus kandeliae TaxID=3129297 RepID=A0ABZ2N2H1_9BACI
MLIKKSADVGRAVTNLLEEEGMTNGQMAFDLNVSTQLVSHYKHDRRPMQQDVGKQAIQIYNDNPEFVGDLLHEFSGGYTSPVFRGKAIERHRLAVEANAEREIKEALQKIEEVCLAKPPAVTTAEEKESIESMMDELVEARAFIDNLIMMLEKEYNISIMQRIKRLIPKWKSKGWLA